MVLSKELDLTDLESLFDNISLKSVINVIEALKNNCRDSSYKDPLYSAFCGILKETETLLQRAYSNNAT